MSTYVASLETYSGPRATSPIRDLRLGAFVSALLTLCAFVIGGYHPFAEDGGIYMAGVERLLHPSLYPYQTAFVLEPTRFSAFASTIAGIVKTTHAGLPIVLLVLHLATLWLTLFASWLLAARCWQTTLERVGAVSLLACWLGLPIAGTALVMMDPYLTARSFSTPAMILALVGMLDTTSPEQHQRMRGTLLCGFALVLAAFMHPLMAAYAIGATIVLGCVQSPIRAVRVWGSCATFTAAILLAAFLQRIGTPEDAAYIRVATSRSYWFLSQWRWFEIVGLIAPLAILALAAHKSALQVARTLEWDSMQRRKQALASAGIWIGSTSLAVSLLFVRVVTLNHLVARLQPLRAFQVVYLIMILMLGAELAKSILRRSPQRWLIAACLLGGAMFIAARNTFPHSSHIELPELVSVNPWEQAFSWIRTHTPQDALFALDADYIHAPQEDAQCFRALAQRSALADDSKDAGEASIAPDLADDWAMAHQAQSGLSRIPDTERRARLRPLGVSWVVLRSEAETRLNCPYANSAVKVCRLQ